MLSTAAPVTSIMKAAPAATKVAATKKTTSSGRWNQPKARGRRTLDERLTVASLHAHRPAVLRPTRAPLAAPPTFVPITPQGGHSRRAPGTDRSGSPQRWAAGAVVARPHGSWT